MMEYLTYILCFLLGCCIAMALSEYWSCEKELFEAYTQLLEEYSKLIEQNNQLKKRCDEYWEEAGLNSDYYE